MKTKIREFARKSHLDVYGLGKDREKWEAVLEEYTQYVLKDCIGVVELWEKDSRNHISYILKKHYGLD